MRLYDLADQYNDLVDMLEGDTTNEILQDLLDGIEGAFDEKVESIVKLMKSKQAEFDAIAAEAKRLTDRAEKVAKSKEWLHDYIQRIMQQMNKTEVKSALFKIQFQNNPQSVNVLNESLIPRKYFVIPPQPAARLDKIALLNDLKQGTVVNGAAVKQEQRLVIK